MPVLGNTHAAGFCRMEFTTSCKFQRMVPCRIWRGREGPGGGEGCCLGRRGGSKA